MSFLDGKPIEGSLELTEESTEELKKLFEFPDDIKKKTMDVYNYMARSQIGRMVFQFDSETRFIMEIDFSKWKDIPRINLEKVPEEMSKEPTDEEVMQYCWKRNLVLISKEQYKALKAGK